MLLLHQILSLKMIIKGKGFKIYPVFFVLQDNHIALVNEALLYKKFQLMLKE